MCFKHSFKKVKAGVGAIRVAEESVVRDSGSGRHAMEGGGEWGKVYQRLSVDLAMSKEDDKQTNSSTHMQS